VVGGGGELASGAEHDAVVPPPDPTHVQDHGPLPLSALAVPALHRPLVGAALTATPFAGPHAPFTMGGGPPPVQSVGTGTGAVSGATVGTAVACPTFGTGQLCGRATSAQGSGDIKDSAAVKNARFQGFTDQYSSTVMFGVPEAETAVHAAPALREPGGVV
jgi:hypothetical protein